MKLILFVLFLGNAFADDAHLISPNHEHLHKKDCSHKTAPHGDHTDYIHENQYHAAHEKHFDTHGLIKNSSADRSTASVLHPVHKNHTHQHATNCGHPAVKHDDHMDYVHEAHYHAAHDDHVDDHGSFATK